MKPVSVLRLAECKRLGMNKSVLLKRMIERETPYLSNGVGWLTKLTIEGLQLRLPLVRLRLEFTNGFQGTGQLAP